MKRTVMSVIFTGGILCAFTVLAPPASATCIDYYEAELMHTDFDGDDKYEVVVYYPPIVEDVDPPDCLRNEPEPPQVATVDLAALADATGLGTA